jgi:hypothetical protein
MNQTLRLLAHAIREYRNVCQKFPENTGAFLLHVINPLDTGQHSKKHAHRQRWLSLFVFLLSRRLP